ncbi:hypothetical protein ITI46_05405 [Streptomyces oryzae]|uniref:Uncharacterized protein n=1 Tax=Streptomyces oryzae TaxID=1434886 RepID=A0ABS3X6Z1_9ACTN|nr:hypothetical protein [Streptomyces oryzae]
MLRPAEEPWPHCEASHLHRDSGVRQSPAQVRLMRRMRARWHGDHGGPGTTPEEETIKKWNAAMLAERLDAGPPLPADCPVPMLPVAQLYLRDIPLLWPPGQADLLRWQTAGANVDSSYADCPQDFYGIHLADAPGWKVGGRPSWGRTDPTRTDPNPRYRSVCDAQMVPLLTIASFEWDGGEGHSWAPYEDQDAANAANIVGHCCGQSPSQPAKVEVGSTDKMQIYVCPTSPEHPHTDLIQ